MVARQEIDSVAAWMRIFDYVYVCVIECVHVSLDWTIDACLRGQIQRATGKLAMLRRLHITTAVNNLPIAEKHLRKSLALPWKLNA